MLIILWGRLTILADTHFVDYIKIVFVGDYHVISVHQRENIGVNLLALKSSGGGVY